ncbi:MAG: acyltransferase family protein [Cyclobacteriaceae bacterium]
MVQKLNECISKYLYFSLLNNKDPEMENELKTTDRIYSLDALRGIMMILGIVLHSSESYNVGGDYIWPKDPSAQHVLMNYINLTIHIFRMPIFFLIAGFFGALLFYEKGPAQMLQNRLKRIIIPFIVFLLILSPVILLALDYTASAFGTSLDGISTRVTFLPKITYHLWFLYYLILITGITFFLATLLKYSPSFTRRITTAFEWLIRNRVSAILLFSLAIFLMLVWMWDLWAPTPLSFVPEYKVLIFYGIFYWFGWTFYKSKHLLSELKKNDKLYAILALTIFTLKFFFSSYIDDVLDGTLNAIVSWLFIFGISGLFIRYSSHHSHQMRYISDSSYWVYLIHLPLTIFIPGLIAHWALPSFIKFLIVMASTSVICFMSYHYLVRGSFIGQFLNGRRYSRK